MTLLRRPGSAGSPPPEQLHVQFGADASRQVAVSWASPVRVARPHLRYGTPGGGLGTTTAAVERSYTEAITGQAVWTYHAAVDALHAGTDYVFEVRHGSGPAAKGRFRTAPAGRSTGFRFTSFGDLGIPEAVGAGLGPASANAAHTVGAVEAAEPLFHLLNGDLSYANLSDAPVETWRAFFANVTRSARNRPWMPCAGNHEIEVGNGPHGHLAYQTRFRLPDNGAGPDCLGNWYAFTVGNVRFVALNADDVCLQDGGYSEHRRRRLRRPSSSYIRGYSGGGQRTWLEGVLAQARQAAEVDWIVVCMHQVAMSSAPFNGADLGIRRELMPLFDRYGVDLVLSGHEHHYERTHPVRGTVAGAGLLTPAVVAGRPDGVVDTTGGTVHVTIGVGGNPTFAGTVPGDTPKGLVIAGVGKPGRGQRVPYKEYEPAEWLAARAVDHPFGFTVFDVDPGVPGGHTRIDAVHHGAWPGSTRYRPVDRFCLTRPRSDARRVVPPTATAAAVTPA